MEGVKNTGGGTFSREVAKIKSQLGANFKGVMSQSFLRAEVYSVDGEGNYTWAFKAAKGDQSPTERLLKDNDMFVAMAVRFALAVKDTNLPAVHVKQYYPNTTIFETETGLAAPGTFIAEHLEAIYNAGTLAYSKGDTTYLPALQLTGARFVGQTQQTSATNKTSTEHDSNGVILLKRPIKMIGTDVGDWDLNVPAANNLKLQYTAGATGHATKKVVLILELHGILVSGGSKIVTAASTSPVE